MKTGLDTNVLVYAHLPVFPESDRVRSYLLRGLADAETTFVVTPLVLHELIHVITDARRFEPAVSMTEATALARSYLGRSNVECVATDEDAFVLALRLLDEQALGRKRIADTLFAATLLRHGVETMVTCNPADFEGFVGLRVLDPRRG